MGLEYWVIVYKLNNDVTGRVTYTKHAYSKEKAIEAFRQYKPEAFILRIESKRLGL